MPPWDEVAWCADIYLGLRAGISCWRGKGKESQGVGRGWRAEIDLVDGQYVKGYFTDKGDAFWKRNLFGQMH